MIVVDMGLTASGNVEANLATVYQVLYLLNMVYEAFGVNDARKICHD